MLVLTRKLGQSLLLGSNITVTVLEISRDRIKVGVEAPAAIRVMRPEAVSQVAEENLRAGQGTPFLRLVPRQEPPATIA